MKNLASNSIKGCTKLSMGMGKRIFYELSFFTKRSKVKHLINEDDC